VKSRQRVPHCTDLATTRRCARAPEASTSTGIFLKVQKYNGVRACVRANLPPDDDDDHKRGRGRTRSRRDGWMARFHSLYDPGACVSLAPQLATTASCVISLAFVGKVSAFGTGVVISSPAVEGSGLPSPSFGTARALKAEAIGGCG
jgi:hypothetical protein